jgi:hypothetical protein
LIPDLLSSSKMFCSMKLPKSPFFRTAPATVWLVG